MNIEELKEGIRNISEPRRTGYGNIRHKLEDIIIIGLCTVICRGEDFADMEAFGKSRQEYPAKFLELLNGIPDSDTFRRVFERLNPSELSSCLINWISDERTKRGTAAIDGKTICGSGNDKHKAYHVISAFAAENQPALYKDTEDYFNEFSGDIPMKTTLDKGHGRIEKREYRLLTELAWLEQKDEWKGLKGLGCVKSTVTEKGESREFTRYFITSLTDIDEFADSVRKHWAIENNLHWCLDVIFKEDASRAKKTILPLFSILCVKSLSILFLRLSISVLVKDV